MHTIILMMAIILLMQSSVMRQQQLQWPWSATTAVVTVANVETGSDNAPATNSTFKCSGGRLSTFFCLCPVQKLFQTWQ